MTIEVLPQDRNILTKPLYEEVFSEDKGPFADYYYEHVAPQSTIYVARDEAGIHAMVHLNPYLLWWSGEIVEIPYIVAVATQEPYRHRGLMRSLLERIFADLTAQHVPFAFLMPVDEAIYRPFGFVRTWPWRWEEEVILGAPAAGLCRGTSVFRMVAEGFSRSLAPGLSEPEKESALDELERDEPVAIPASDCSDETLQELSSYVNRFLKEHFELFTYRSAAYYRRLDMEQKASGSSGRLEILFRDGSPVAARQTERED